MPAKAKKEKTETTSISVGDQVRVPPEVDNTYAGYQVPAEEKRTFLAELSVAYP